MKYLCVIFCTLFFSCSPKIIKQPLSQEILMNKALQKLHIKKSKISFVASKIVANNSNETILVLAEDENDTLIKDIEHYTSHILIVNSRTGKIKNYFSEKSKKNGWISDAIFIDDIRIDTTSYKLNASKNAFGVLVKFRSMSQPNPYYQEKTSLYIKEKDNLKKVLDNYTTYESKGIVNVNTCYANFKIVKNTLIMTNEKSNRYNNMAVNKTITQRNFVKDENGERNPINKIIPAEEIIFKFNGITYKKETQQSIKRQK